MSLKMARGLLALLALVVAAPGAAGQDRQRRPQPAGGGVIVVKPKGALPDLTIKDMQVSLDRLQLRVLVENAGAGAAPAAMLSLKPLNTTQAVPALAPNESKWINLDVSHNPAGTQYYTATVGGGFGNIEETDTKNNEYTIPNLIEPVTLAPAGSPPDLIVAEIRNPQIIDGKNYLRARLVNRGGTAAGAFYVDFTSYLGNDYEKTKKKHGVFVVGNLAPGQETWAMFQLAMPSSGSGTMNVPGPAGGSLPAGGALGGIAGAISNAQTVFRITVDDQNNVKEADESNNELYWNMGKNYKPKK